MWSPQPNQNSNLRQSQFGQLGSACGPRGRLAINIELNTSALHMTPHDSIVIRDCKRGLSGYPIWQQSENLHLACDTIQMDKRSSEVQSITPSGFVRSFSHTSWP